MHCSSATRAASLALASSVASCQPYLFEQQCSESVRETTVEPTTFEPIPADILFVIDDSGSMEEEQTNLERNFAEFIDVLTASSGSYRIAITTTSLGTDSDFGVGFRSSYVFEERPYPILVTSDEGCQPAPPPSGCFRPTPSGPWLDSSTDLREDIILGFQQAALVGTCGYGQERGTRAMVAALEQSLGADGCNQGFLRDDANLVVIFVTDEDDFGPEEPADIVQQLASFKPLERIRIAVIGGFVLTETGAGEVVDRTASKCRTGPMGTAVAACGSACQTFTPSPNPTIECTASGDNCEDFQVCQDLQGDMLGPVCVDQAFVGWTEGRSGWGCDSCSLVPTEDCCQSDDPGQNYEAFLDAFEAAATTSTTSGLTANRCLPVQDGKPVCLIDSICQEEFADTLRRIATDLISTNTVRLSPPAANPDGVRVRILGPSPRELVPNIDFRVNQGGTELTLSTLPSDLETLQVLFTTESGPTGPPVGACP